MQAGIKKALELEYEAFKKQMIERLDREKDLMISSIALHLMKEMSITTLNEHITITIKTTPLK